MNDKINKDIISDATAGTNQLQQQVADTIKKLEELVKWQKELNTAGEKNSKVYQDVSAQIRLAKDAVKEHTAQIDANLKALKLSKNSLEQNKGLLEALKAQYDLLTKSQGDNSREAKALNEQIGTLTNTITRQEEKLEKSRKVFDRHGETNKAFSASFDALKTKADEFKLGSVLEDTAQGFNVMKSGLSAIKTGFNGVGGAIKTTGFGLLLLVLQSVVEYFTNTSDGAKKLQAILSYVSVVVKAFKDGLGNLGRVLVDTFTNPIASIKKLGQMLVDNVLNRFKAVMVIWDGIKDGFNFKKIANGLLQATTGVTNLADKATAAYDKVKKTTSEATKAIEANSKAAEVQHTGETKRHKERMQMHKEERSALKNKDGATPVNETARPAVELLEAKSIDFAKSMEQDQMHYDEEMALLDEQLEKKLITQEKYEQQNAALQEKHHLAIGRTIKSFHVADLDEVKQHIENLATIQGHDEKMAQDEKDLKKAILPGDILKAEQKLVDDKYSYEIALAEGNKEKIKQLEIEKEQAKTDIARRYEEQRKAFVMQTAQQVTDAAFSMLKGSIQSQSAAKLKGLETQKQAELSNTSLTAGQKKVIEERYKKKEAEEKVKAFKAEQRASILQAVVNGALAITKATAQTGVLAPFVIPGIIASTAIQVATIAKQKAPQYAKGGLHYQSDGRGALLSGYSRTDDTNAFLRSGEAVVVSEAMRNPWARNLVSAINVAHGGRDFSVSNPGRGYAIGGIYTDGGNANRYYSAPANDAKDLANTLAYQMINNFPPIYVDVKDVNNQQNILAQTVNRVNL